MNKTKKILLTLGALSVLVTLVGATLLQSVGTLQTTANISQAVTFDDHNYDAPVNETIDGYGGCYYFSTIHELQNHGFDGVWLGLNHAGAPDLDGIEITVFYRLHHYEKDFVDEPLTVDSLKAWWMPLNTPFYIPGHMTYDVCWLYHFNSFIVPQQYLISSVFVPATPL